MHCVQNQKPKTVRKEMIRKKELFWGGALELRWHRVSYSKKLSAVKTSVDCSQVLAAVHVTGQWGCSCVIMCIKGRLARPADWLTGGVGL